ncbi:hypothetical protein [Pseudooceanicola sp. LIPI14-2-Ac024]|uniref:hypothetical protein n=1 Tax=Pseudooceanicola sp. LIPI14-2-Ac024 TaxID=3344875 RepID=UPI0035D0276E
MTKPMQTFRRAALGAVALAGLAACASQVPDSGVGFGSYDSYNAQREAQLQGQNASALPPAQAISSEPLSAVNVPFEAETPVTTAGGDTPEGIAAETQAALRASAQNSGAAPLQADPANPAPEAVNTFGISRENDFGAVDEQRSIEADKERLAQVRSEYQQVQPTALPERTGSGPNIVSFALQTQNNPGQSLYSRSSLLSEQRFKRNCARYASPDLAQTDFLKKGGPERDRDGLDPDGDGFACSWDPRPFRTARGG